MKSVFTIIFTIIVLTTAKTQDIHFTMWDANPITINPATAGAFNENIRGVINYRNQWASVDNAYKTYAIMLDRNFFKSKWRNGYIGGGLSAYKDIALKYETTTISLALSSVLYLNSTNIFSVGFMGGWGQNSLNTNDLKWDSQFNGQTYDPLSGSNETFNFENNNYTDFSTGIFWAHGDLIKSIYSNGGFNIKTGVAFHHITRSNNSLSPTVSNKLYPKLVFHTNMHIGINNTKIALNPKFLSFLQGPSKAFVGGLFIKYLIKEELKSSDTFKKVAISIGSYYRVGDALSPSIEFDFSKFAVGVAYDMNISGLATATNGNGGPEFFIRFQNIKPLLSQEGSVTSPRFR